MNKMNRLKLFKSIIKGIESLENGEYFYTSQPGKSIFASIAKSDKKLYIKTKKCFVIDPITGNLLDTITKVIKQAN